jgi:phospholipase/carboxylesterase
MTGKCAGSATGLVCALVCGATIVIAQPGVSTVDNPASGLRTLEVGSGAKPFVLLHGYGSRPENWLPFASTIQVNAGRRFVFPRGPETTTPPDGPGDGRAWWRLDLASFIPRGSALPNLSQAKPPGLAGAATRVRALLDEVRTRSTAAPDRLILGGFSQGAMVAAEIAFRSDRPMQALVLLSPTPVDEAAWTTGMAARRGLPVFIAHGRHDTILSFALAQRLAAAMQREGLRVTFFAFDDGHEIPAVTVNALNRFLAGIDVP